MLKTNSFSTLIKFNLKSSNFEYQYNNIIDKLKDISNTYNIIIITNQVYNKYDLFEEKINKLFDEFTSHNLYIRVFVSSKNDLYRKPNINMIKVIENIYNNKLKYYCRDALERQDEHANTDLKFGLNLGFYIFSPEYNYR